jgi:glutamyl-tRNA reductase
MSNETTITTPANERMSDEAMKAATEECITELLRFAQERVADALESGENPDACFEKVWKHVHATCDKLPHDVLVQLTAEAFYAEVKKACMKSVMQCFVNLMGGPKADAPLNAERD